MKWTPEKLIAFEDDIAAEFAKGNIKAPIHLGGGNERDLINIFKEIDIEDDWVLAGWRSHYHCLLKGVPPKKLKAAIMAGRSVSLCFPEHKIICSGIVGGVAPIAAGIAFAMRGPRNYDTVHVFLGDMTAKSGIVHEAMSYAAGHDLPIQWYIEDNGISVCTDTQASWGAARDYPSVETYDYTLTRPHSGIGKWIRF